MGCAILSPAGDNKYKLMSAIHKDERSKLIDPHYEILHRLFMGNVVRMHEVASFQEQLKEHQKVRGSDGYSVLQRALLEHNIVVLSKIYLNISFTQMGAFLDISAEDAESIIGDMISQNRILAQLDQRTNSIDFHVEIGSKAVQVAGTTVMGAAADAEEDLAKD